MRPVLAAAGLALVARATRVVTNLPTNGTVSVRGHGPLYGEDGCQCVGVDQIYGKTEATLKNGTKVDYPADLGARCEAWDNYKHPSCPGEPWCEAKWCYVDPCKCKGVAAPPKPSIYMKGAMYQGKPVHFSYATCGNLDSYSAEDEKKTAKDIEKTCAVTVDPAVWGNDKCRCIGIGPQPGYTDVSISGKIVAYPADTGATCQSWDAGRHPDCPGNVTESPWCAEKWCYVDPCSCKLESPPKTSSYVPGALYQGKPVYYSYSTCGGSDSYTGSRKEACVNQKSKGDCGKLTKCAWTGKECLGKELAETC